MTLSPVVTQPKTSSLSTNSVSTSPAATSPTTQPSTPFSENPEEAHTTSTPRFDSETAANGPYSLRPDRLTHRSPYPHRTRQLALLSLVCTIVVTVFLTALISHPLLTAHIALEQKKLEAAATQQAQLAQTQQVQLQRAEFLKGLGGEANALACTANMKSLLQTEPAGIVHTQSQALLRDCQNQLGIIQLSQAKQAAAANHLSWAIARANQVEGDHQAQAQSWTNAWSKQMLDSAETYYQQGNLSAMEKVIGAIAPENLLYPSSQATLHAWKTEWAENARHWEQAQLSFTDDQIEAARTHLAQISSHPYWNQKSLQLKQAVEQRYQESEALYKQSQQALIEKDYQRAIELASALPNSPPWRNFKQRTLEQAESVCRGRSLQTGVIIWGAGVLSGWVLYLSGRR